MCRSDQQMALSGFLNIRDILKAGQRQFLL